MKNLQTYNKFFIAAIGAVLSLFVGMYPDTPLAGYASMVLAVLTALGVYVVPNKGAK